MTSSPAPKKRRGHRELTFTEAVAALQELGTVADYAERYIEAAVTKAQDEACAEYDAKRAAILSRLPEDVRELAKAKVPSIPEEVESAEPEPSAEELPRGALPLDPKREQRLREMAK